MDDLDEAAFDEIPAAADELFQKVVRRTSNDATATIAGFYYQLLLTLKRLLELREGQSVAMEFSEDVDYISQNTAGDPLFVFEQAKHEKKSCTLANSGFLKTLIHAVGHIQRNAKNGLSDKWFNGTWQVWYTTTATASRDSELAFSNNRRSGIAVWAEFNRDPATLTTFDALVIQRRVLQALADTTLVIGRDKDYLLGAVNNIEFFLYLMRGIIVNLGVFDKTIGSDLKASLAQLGVPPLRQGTLIAVLISTLMKRASQGDTFISKEEIVAVIHEFMSLSQPALMIPRAYKAFLKRSVQLHSFDGAELDHHYYRVLKALLRLRSLHAHNLETYKTEYKNNGKFTPKERSNIRNIYFDYHMKSAWKDISLTTVGE